MQDLYNKEALKVKVNFQETMQLMTFLRKMFYAILKICLINQEGEQ